MEQPPEQRERVERFLRETLPVAPITGLTRPFLHFLHIESASGIVLIACTAVAIVLANSAWSEPFLAFWNQPARIGVDGFMLDYPLWYWVNDGLMTIFFFLIGLEIKREIVSGELSDKRKIVLPVVAAIGGAAMPAAIFVAMQWGQPGLRGWAIPMATDIAFVVGCLALLGSRVPPGLKIFVLTLAIVDDILAVLIIALFYSGAIKLAWIGGAVVGFGLIAGLNRLGVRTVAMYVFVGAGIWLCALKSGVHPTVAGVLLGLLTPAGAWIGSRSLLDVLRGAPDALADGTRSERNAMLRRLRIVSRETISPLERLEFALHPWVGFVIIPIFALANAGVPITVGASKDALAIAVAAGLVIGKPLGIVLSSWLVVRLRWGTLPAGVNWPVLAGAGCLAGIGFTMSLFVASLGLEANPLVAAKTGILIGSALSAALGMGVLWFALKPATG